MGRLAPDTLIVEEPMQNTTISVVSGHPCVIDGPEVTESDLTDLISHWTDRISRVLHDQPDLVVLPELFERPVQAASPQAVQLSVEAKHAFVELRGSRFRDALAELAVAHRTHITYPAYRVAEDGTLRNSVEIIGRDGSSAAVYDKIVPTLGEIRDIGIVPGQQAMAADLDFGRVSAAICFDLNFEPVRAAVAATQPQLIIFPSAYHGDLMQQYWAASCRSYFVGCVYPPNRSAILSPTGQIVGSTSTYDWLLTRTVNLDYACAHLDFNREKLLALKARYGRRVQIDDPGRLGYVLVSSQTEDVSAAEMLAEFEIADVDTYFAESTAHLAESPIIAHTVTAG